MASATIYSDPKNGVVILPGSGPVPCDGGTFLRSPGFVNEILNSAMRGPVDKSGRV